MAESEITITKSWQDRVLDKLDAVGNTATATETKVDMSLEQNETQFELIGANTERIVAVETKMDAVQNHRTGRNWLAKLAIWIILGRL